MIIDIILRYCSRSGLFKDLAEEVIHVNGSIKDKDITLGIDNENQLQVNYSIDKKTQRAIFKPLFNREIDEHREKTVKNWIDSSSNICCFGMPLGDSDLLWRDFLIESLKNIVTSNYLYISMICLT